MSETATPPVEVKRSYAWVVLVFMLLLYLLNCADRYVAVGLLEDIKAEFDVSDTFMGFLVGPAFAFVYTFLAIPIAVLADRVNRVRIIVTGAIVWSAFTVFSGLAETPTQFALARLGVGVGEAAFLAPAFSVLSDYFPPAKRALAFAILNFGVYFGQIFGLVGGAQIAAATDWRTAFIVLGAPGIMIAILTLFVVKEPERGRLDPARQSTERPRLWPTVKLLCSTPTFLWMLIGVGLGGFASYGFGIWAPTLFARAFDLPLTEANARYGGPSFIAGLSGALLIGVLCDRLAARNSRWPYRLSAMGLAGFFVTMFWLCFTDSVTLATILTFPAGLMAGGWVIAQQAALQDLLPASIRATATSVWAFALTFAGLVLGVQLAGILTDILSDQYGTQAIRYALAAILLVNIPAIGALLMAGRRFEQDRADLAARA